ncbi:AbrB/MazE/SpoVT family DNA-binding domain-containing protein [Streptococcus chenjunshii]|uniref:AbrB/MazE/SpoVT family DNA-binding domain-containing protein n=1 Tax=Streptococcus chenjunshii TaxID=2173853 RepID=A0A372KPJ9_9STRE|nr:AbrB/MazE/SpoVT family DNA-binding domain-containing protein [Streptococcus chenjunshii]AXQ78494.1 AbrB/MazE/SpoVT family DNA-binding domain-containing protein [Streptococcus chenjunshii]RFU52045.1 AbrB/MazE/SpoVT family DNA-binding domain-containing protein [Streptococcus chenjunshii]RFU54237.1 AbrB/MazE/SpoVT family DNA-binding domain-containing protein [Streptococcus chenjunshii]
MQLTVNKWGNSSAIRLPKQLVQQLQLQVNDVLDYKVSGNKIILEKVATVPELTVEELFKDYQGEPVDVTPVLFERRGNEQW